MRKRNYFLLLLIAMLALLAGVTVSAAANTSNRLQIYFSPHILDEATGEVIVDVNIRHYDAGVPDYLGAMCAFTFACEIPAEQFDVKPDEKGNPAMTVDAQTLVELPADLEAVKDENQLTFTFMDSTLMDQLIDRDGTLFRFTLLAKNPRSLWNSTDYYPLRFVPGSIGIVTYSLENYSVGRYYDAEALDGKVGGYNLPPTLTPPAVGKRLTFTEGSAELELDGTAVSMDVPTIRQDNRLMIPVRFFAESIGMEVVWEQDVLRASAYTDYKTLTIALSSNTLYINAVQRTADVAPFEMDGRIYISAETVKALYPNAEISEESDKLSVYIP